MIIEKQGQEDCDCNCSVNIGQIHRMIPTLFSLSLSLSLIFFFFPLTSKSVTFTNREHMANMFSFLFPLVVFTVHSTHYKTEIIITVVQALVIQTTVSTSLQCIRLTCFFKFDFLYVRKTQYGQHCCLSLPQNIF